MRFGIGALIAALSVSLAASVSAQEAAPVAPPAVHHLDGCPKNVADFENSDATLKLVEKCLGRPARKMPGRGDDVIYQYDVRGGSIMLVFVFDHAGAMTHFRAYAHQ